MTISDQLARHARRTPDVSALRFDGLDRSYRELDERVNRLARTLLDRGVTAGDCVVTLCHNSPELIETYFACARIGAICVPLNFRSAAAEVEYLLDDSGAEHVVVDAALVPVLALASTGRTLRTCLVVGAWDGTADAEGFDAALSAADPSPVAIAVDELAPALIMYTSGTTGRPKGAMLSHYNLMVQCMSRIAHIGLPTDCHVWLIATPLFHIGAFSGMLPAIQVGATVVLARSGAFDAVEIVDVLERERVGYCFLVPAQWQAICAVPGIAERELSALQLISWGAAPATTTLIRTLLDTFPSASIFSAFGQTETCPVTTLLLGEDAERKLGAVGTPLLNVEVRIVDADMNDVATGEIGEIVYRGPSVMTGYWNKPEATAAAFSGGWFHSGDLVRQDEDGYIYVVDRLKDMIISGGENIYCAEVEDVIAAHPEVAEVAVIAAPHEVWGEVPHAVVVPRDPAAPPTLDGLTDWSRERLAGYKCPKLLTVLPELPRNTTGKVQKNVLRTQLLPARSGAEAGRA
ncbi:long-chain-fatty-acid--CoA ligase [Rhodococcus sp. ACT016]|uniref:long-chain-fatty-acid--CoA ligase n=1 Tax=Rhodococcus sp. ACT016 TaxID=3134808 RepID=UPI003D28C704